GTFSPALLGLAFLDLRALPWGLGIFVLTVLVGWLLRRAIERYHLLLVPRTAILLTLIVLFLIVVITTASHYDVAVTTYIALFLIGRYTGYRVSELYRFQDLIVENEGRGARGEGRESLLTPRPSPLAPFPDPAEEEPK